MDWNWFFSSLAQSVAALVGVVGAFLISNLLNNQASYARNRSRTRELLRDSERLTDTARGRFFGWYNALTLRSALEEVERYVRTTRKQIDDVEDIYTSYAFPEYIPRQECLQAIRRVVDSERDRRAQWATEWTGSTGLSPTSNALPNDSTFSDANDESSIGRPLYEEEREAIHRLEIALRSHLRAVAEHLEIVRRHPESSKVVRGILAAILLLFWFGVIYPLSFMPVSARGPGPLSLSAFFEILLSLRGLLLTLTCSVFTGLILYLWKLNNALRHSSDDIELLEYRLDPANYSEYLKVRFDNERSCMEPEITSTPSRRSQARGQHSQ